MFDEWNGLRYTEGDPMLKERTIYAPIHYFLHADVFLGRNYE